MPADSMLVLVRHGESAWNRDNRFTGWTDIQLTPQGMEDARQVGRQLRSRGCRFDLAFTSHLTRAWTSLLAILDELGQEGLPICASKALNECNYGELTGLDKDDAARRWGEAQVRNWRRAYAGRPPGGESLQDVAARALPFLEAQVLPLVRDGRHVLVVSHSHTLRALVMQLEQLTPEEIADVEIPNGQIRTYRYAGRDRPATVEVSAAGPSS